MRTYIVAICIVIVAAISFGAVRYNGSPWPGKYQAVLDSKGTMMLLDTSTGALYEMKRTERVERVEGGFELRDLPEPTWVLYCKKFKT